MYNFNLRVWTGTDCGDLSLASNLPAQISALITSLDALVKSAEQLKQQAERAEARATEAEAAQDSSAAELQRTMDAAEERALYAEDINDGVHPTAGALRTYASRGWCMLELFVFNSVRECALFDEKTDLVVMPLAGAQEELKELTKNFDIVSKTKKACSLSIMVIFASIALLLR